MTDQDGGAAAPSAEGGKRIKVWDPPTRIFHWLLAIGVVLSYATGEIGGLSFTMPVTGAYIDNMVLHTWSGYTILALILFRVVWGFIGSEPSRFRAFLFGPQAIIDYIKRLFGGPTPFHAGHNPAGGLVVLVMLIVLLVQAVTGLFSQDANFIPTTGPLVYLVGDDLSKQITSIHKQWYELILILVVLHIAANLFYWLIKRQDLIMGMITGRRMLPPGESNPGYTYANAGKAIAIATVAAVLVWVVVNLESF